MNELALVLFDIDGTLLDTHGAGRAAFVRALKTVFGWDDDLSYIRFFGTTDLDVLRAVGRRYDTEIGPDDEERFFRRLPLDLAATIRETETRLHPGVRELVGAIAAHPRAVAGIVTGNIEECARIKLEQCGLRGHFLLGAFGHEHADRNDIARLAVARAEEAVRPRRIGSRFLVGDTPSDIAAARAIGAVSIAAATGGHRAEEHAAAGADHVLPDLRDLDRVMRILGLR